MRPTLTLVVLALNAPAAAHDFWLQPARFQTAPGVALPFTVEVGHGRDRGRWAGGAGRIVTLASIGPDGRVDQRAAYLGARAAADMAPVFASPGVHVLAMHTTHAVSDLPGPRYNEFARLEGLTPALTYRARNGLNERPGREIYSRRAKVLVQVGQTTAGQNPGVTRPVGLSLEIVPDRDPYALGADRRLPVHVLFEGRRLAGATVKLTNLDFDAKPTAVALTDARGRATFRVPPAGQWLLNVVWTKRIANEPRGDFDTTFSSLTFGYARTPSPK